MKEGGEPLCGKAVNGFREETDAFMDLLYVLRKSSLFEYRARTLERSATRPNLSAGWILLCRVEQS